MSDFINGWTKKSVIKHIEENFKGQASSGSTCQYLTEDGKKCAVGLFIPDGHPGQKMTKAVCILLTEYPDLCIKMPLTNEHLENLQLIHDQNLFVEHNAENDIEILDMMISYVESLKD